MSESRMQPLASPTGAARGVHLTFLDSLRGLAILLVLLVHAGGAAHILQNSNTLHLLMLGQRGVELFYMVSAFTLFLSLDHARPERRPMLNFYLRRFFRIAPAFYLAVLLEFLVIGVHVGQQWRYGLAIVFLNAWSVQAINLKIIGCWSIAVECTFYFILPALHQHIRTFRSALMWFAWASAITVPLSFFLSYWLRNQYVEYFELFWFPIQFPVFLLGILTYTVWKKMRTLPQTAVSSRLPEARYLPAVLYLLAFVLFFSNTDFGSDHHLFNLRLLPSVLSFVFLILAGALQPWRIIFNRFTAFLGKISYSMYLAHFFILWQYNRLFPVPLFSGWGHFQSSIAHFFLLLGIMIPISWGLWKSVEQPGVKLGRMLIQYLEQRSSLPPSTIADRAGI